MLRQLNFVSKGLIGIVFAVIVLAYHMRLFEVSHQRLSISIVNPLELLLFAYMAFFMLFVQVLFEVFVVEEILLAKFALWMKGDQIAFLVILAFHQMASQFISGVALILVHQQHLIGDTKITKKSSVVSGKMFLVIINVFKILLTYTAVY